LCAATLEVSCKIFHVTDWIVVGLHAYMHSQCCAWRILHRHLSWLIHLYMPLYESMGKIILLCDILTICVGLVHILHLAITVLIRLVEITTSIEMTKPAIVTLTFTNTIVNPYLSYNRSPHDCHCHSVIAMEAS
jgi:hypothetical protein